MSEVMPLQMDAENTFAAFEGLWSSGQLSAADIARLPAVGIATVINLALPTAPNALVGEPEQVTALGGKPVWLHCAKNMRASAFVYLYRRLIRDEPEEQAAWPMLQIWTSNAVWQQWTCAVRAAHRHGAAH
ncbi:MAG: protein tyrosine phosphatase family protein [Thiomonas sp.]|nr:protein tyrosine phosphatase family protein [Thiomonas sp.]